MQKKYENELKQLFTETYFKEKYKYSNYGNYYNEYKAKDSTWQGMEYVSVDKDGDIIGYVSYDVERYSNNCFGLYIINFKDGSNTFMKDVLQIIDDMFCRFNYNKLSFSVVIGNKAESAYDKFVDKFGGRIVGVRKNHVVLYDNKRYDEKLYEIEQFNYKISKGVWD